MILSQIPKDIPDPESFLGFILWQKSHSWEAHVNNALKDLGTTQSLVFLLITIFVLLKKLPEVTQTELATAIKLSPMSISKSLLSLEKKDLIKRSKGTDPRSNSIKISPKGLRLLVDSANIISQAHSSFFLPNGQKETLEYLRKLK